MLFDAGAASADVGGESAYHHRTFATLSVQAEQTAGSELSLTVGLTIDGDGTTCGTDTSLTVEVGDALDFCYTVSNHSATALAYSTLDDTIDGRLFTNRPTAIAAGGGSYVFHRRIVATASHTYAATWTARDVLPGYTPDDTAPAAFVDISTTGAALGLADDSAAGITIPFQFPFYGVSSNLLCVGENGGIVFGATQCSVSPYNFELPATNSGLAGQALILPFWDDLFGGSGGNVWWQAQGTSPNRQAIVQWNLPHYLSGSASPSRADLEVILDESGAIAFQYQSTVFGSTNFDNGASATIGLQNADGSIADQYSTDSALAHPAPSAIQWTLRASTSYSASASVALDVGLPAIAIAPASVSKSAPSGSQAAVTAALTIANTGNRNLDWNVGEAPNSHMHFPRTSRSVVHGSDAHAPVFARWAQPDAAAAAKPPLAVGSDPLAGAGVPAYAFSNPSLNLYSYLSLDLAAAGTLNLIRQSAVVSAFAAAFLDNDFSKEYIITSDGVLGAVDHEFGSVDTASGVYSAIAEVSGDATGHAFVGMTADPTSGRLYALSVGTGSVPQSLYAIDRATGAGTLIGPIGGPDIDPATSTFSAIAISPEGLMYGLEIESDVLLAIDKTNGNARVIGPTGIDAHFAPAAAFDPSTGVLYWAAYLGSASGHSITNVYTLNLLTGAATEVAPVADGTQLGGLAIALPYTDCVHPGDVSWLSLAPVNGTVVPGDAAAVSTVALNPAGLVDGYYTANVCVMSNDPDRRTVVVPVDFTVGQVIPVATSAPATLAFAVDFNRSGEQTLTIANSGSPGSRVTYAMTESTGDCATPSDVPWLSATPTAGDVLAGSPASVTVTADAGTARLAPGSYSASLCLTAHDTEQRLTTIPIQLVVGAPDLVFKDSFDGGSDGPGLYDNRADFAAAITSIYENAFDDVQPSDEPLAAMSFSDPATGLAYTIDSLPDPNGLWSSTGGNVSTDFSRGQVIVTFTGAPVTAVGGNVYATGTDGELLAGNAVLITLDDGSTQAFTFTTGAQTDFYGFTTLAPIRSITLDAPLDPSDLSWVTLDNLIVGRY